jgi:hypothetical protein
MVITNLLLIAVIIVNLIDLSGFIDEIEKGLSKWLHINAHIPKPFSCSYCLTHWVGLIYLIASGQITLANYAILLVICFLTPEINDIELWFKQAIDRILATFFDMLKR